MLKFFRMHTNGKLLSACTKISGDEILKILCLYEKGNFFLHHPAMKQLHEILLTETIR